MIASAPLIIDASVRARLNALRVAATLTPVDVTKLGEKLETPEGKAAHMRTTQEQTVVITGPYNFVVVYTVESGHPAGLCRHMSMSIDRHERVPSPEAVWLIARELGFTGELRDCVVWLEDLLQGRTVNVVQPIKLTSAKVEPAT